MHDIRARNPLEVNYGEFAAMVRDIRSARTWTGRLGYMFAPPGYREAPTADSSTLVRTDAESAGIAPAPAPRFHPGPALPADPTDPGAVIDPAEVADERIGSPLVSTAR